MGGYEFQRAELDALEGVLRDASAEPMSLTLPLLRHITNDFSPESQIGQDDSAVVYLGVLPSGCRVAVKKLQLHHCLDDENEDAFLIEYNKMKDTFQNEVSAAMKPSHKNTVRLIGYYHHTQEQIVEYEGKQDFAGVLERLICTEYVPDGTLCGHIESKICTEMDGYEFQRAELDALERVVRDTSAEPMSLTLPLLRHITNDFSDESQIGQGGFAVVYLGVLPSGLRIAVKKLGLTSFLDESAFQNEVFITMKATHKYTVRFMGYCSQTQHELFKHDGELFKHDGQHVFAQVLVRLICVEYAPKGTLDTHIGDYGELDWNQRFQILKGICQGLHHLHDEMHVFHGDIKPGNILIGDNLVPKIYDFGTSQIFEEEETERTVERMAGTIGYLAPEVYTNNMVSFKADIYSLGVVITEFLTGEKRPRPSVDQVLKELRRRLVKEGAFSSWENKYHQVRTCLEIGQDCTDFNPNKRPTLLEIIQRLNEAEDMNYLNEAEDMNYSAASLWQPLPNCPSPPPTTSPYSSHNSSSARSRGAAPAASRLHVVVPFLTPAVCATATALGSRPAPPRQKTKSADSLPIHRHLSPSPALDAQGFPYSLRWTRRTRWASRRTTPSASSSARMWPPGQTTSTAPVRVPSTGRSWSSASSRRSSPGHRGRRRAMSGF